MKRFAPRSPGYPAFPGYPTTEATATWLVAVSSILASFLLLAGLTFLGMGLVGVVDAISYVSAPVCRPFQNASCREVRRGSVLDAGVALPGLRGEHYEVKVQFGNEPPPIRFSSAGQFDGRMASGDNVDVTYWHGRATQVADRLTVMHTANEPSEEYRNALLGGSALVAFGVGTYWRYIRGPLRDLWRGTFRRSERPL